MPCIPFSIIILLHPSSLSKTTSITPDPNASHSGLAPKAGAPDSYFFLCWNFYRSQNLELCTAYPFFSYDIQIFLCISFATDMIISVKNIQPFEKLIKLTFSCGKMYLLM
jgi:hypothetical protein